MKRPSELHFNHLFVDSFPGDTSGDTQPRSTLGVLYAKAKPHTVESPKLLGWSAPLACALGIKRPESAEDLSILVGNKLTNTMSPYASCYGGHQFGHWADQLGDGRAITLGELHQTRYAPLAELQLKGAGITPYSRRGDGKAVLRSSLREYLMSEAMYHLGIPTTRALSLCTTGEFAWRDLFYDGHPRVEPTAIVLRVAPSFLRFGHFELLSAREEYQNLYQLIEWVINQYYPQINNDGLKGDERLLKFFELVMLKTADLMVEWMRVGFCHGVMNTDNMSILGLTIDYGPYAMLDEFHPLFTPNTTDLPGRRYAFSRQPGVALWNLERLADALTPMLSHGKSFEPILKNYTKYFTQNYYQMMGRKLGLESVTDEGQVLINKLLQKLERYQLDYTLFFKEVESINNWQKLTHRFLELPEQQDLDQLRDKIFELQEDQEIPLQKIYELRKKNNPQFVLKNFMLKRLADKVEQGDHTLLERLEVAIQQPYRENEFDLMRPESASLENGETLLSCSS